MSLEDAWRLMRPNAKRARSMVDLALGNGDGHVLPMGGILNPGMPFWDIDIPEEPSPALPPIVAEPVVANKHKHNMLSAKNPHSSPGAR